MRVKLTQNGQRGDVPQQATFDTASPVDLDTLATIMELDENEILFHMEEDGRVDTREFTLVPDEDWNKPERMEEAVRWLDLMYEAMTPEIFDTLAGSLEYTANRKDAEAREREALEQEDARRQAEIDDARSREGVFVIGWNKAGFSPVVEPEEITGTIGEAWDQLATLLEEDTNAMIEESIEEYGEVQPEAKELAEQRRPSVEMMREVMVSEGTIQVAGGLEFWLKEGERG